MAKKDIVDKKDIILIVDTFYNKVKKDEQLKHYFKKTHWDSHLKIMYDFWENAIFYTGTYAGNPMRIHEGLHNKMPLSADDFKRWIALFIITVDELFSGKTAELIKQKAISIATVMQIKILKKDLQTQ